MSRKITVENGPEFSPGYVEPPPIDPKSPMFATLRDRYTAHPDKTEIEAGAKGLVDFAVEAMESREDLPWDKLDEENKHQVRFIVMVILDAIKEAKNS